MRLGHYYELLLEQDGDRLGVFPWGPGDEGAPFFPTTCLYLERATDEPGHGVVFSLTPGNVDALKRLLELSLDQSKRAG